MNFSQAVKGQLTRSGAIRAIHSQAETEIGRKLSPEEATSLWCGKTSPNALLEGIQKVKKYNKILKLVAYTLYFFYFFLNIYFSMDLAS